MVNGLRSEPEALQTAIGHKYLDILYYGWADSIHTV
jgi:hypothetical protein